MSFLTDLLKALNDEELKQLHRVVVTLKEGEVLKLSIKHSRAEKSDKELQQSLNLSKNYFDKINSTLLSKALEYLAGNNLAERLHYLLNKQLFSLVMHELKLEEKRVNKLNNKQAFKAFYLMAFNALIRFNFNDFPYELMEYYGKAYIDNTGEEDMENKYRVIAKTNEQLIRYFRFRQNNKHRIQEAFEVLTKIEKEIAGKGLYLAEANLYVALSAYYEMNDSGITLEYMTKAEDIANTVGDKLDERQAAFISVMKAGLLMDVNRFSEAIAGYRCAIDKYPLLVGSRIYHTYNYTYCLLIEGLHSEAFKAMEKYLSPFLQNENAKNFHFDVYRMYVIYYLLNNNIEAAKEYVQRLQQFGKEEFTPYGDGIWRFVHNVYIAQTGDYILAADLVKKNLKFIYSKPEIHSFDILKEMFLILGTMLRIKQGQSSVKSGNIDKQMEMLYDKSRMHYRLLKNFEQANEPK